jgi:hypothetical protein
MHEPRFRWHWDIFERLSGRPGGVFVRMVAPSEHQGMGLARHFPMACASAMAGL